MTVDDFRKACLRHQSTTGTWPDAAYVGVDDAGDFKEAYNRLTVNDLHARRQLFSHRDGEPGEGPILHLLDVEVLIVNRRRHLCLIQKLKPS